MTIELSKNCSGNVQELCMKLPRKLSKNCSRVCLGNRPKIVHRDVHDIAHEIAHEIAHKIAIKIVREFVLKLSTNCS